MSSILFLGFSKKIKFNLVQSCPNVSTTTIMAMGCRQCLPLSVVQLKGKDCSKSHCPIGVVDTFKSSFPNPSTARNNQELPRLRKTLPSRQQRIHRQQAQWDSLHRDRTRKIRKHRVKNVTQHMVTIGMFLYIRSITKGMEWKKNKTQQNVRPILKHLRISSPPDAGDLHGIQVRQLCV